MQSRKPEWTPKNAGSEFASRVMPATEAATKPISHYRAGKSYDLDMLCSGVREGNRTLLSKAITLIESNSNKHFGQGQELIKRLLPYSGSSIRIAITGTPGAGKSTFIEAFGTWLIGQGFKVAVLAIDPSSSLSKGSILGDKTRMEKLSCLPESFIRPSPSGGVLGGVARKTRESIILCEAAGYDVVLVETVGVGQSETTVRSMVDFFLLLQISGAGDELQGIKKGIMELADLILVNKADGANQLWAEQTKVELANVLHYLRPITPGWKTEALTCSALTGAGIPEVWQMIQKFREETTKSGQFEARRRQQVSNWFDTLLTEAVLGKFFSDPGKKLLVDKIRQEVEQGELPVVMAVQSLIEHP